MRLCTVVTFSSRFLRRRNPTSSCQGEVGLLLLSLRVAFDVPAGKKVARVEALRAGAVLPFRQEGRTVRFEVPTVADYEVVALT